MQIHLKAEVRQRDRGDAETEEREEQRDRGSHSDKRREERRIQRQRHPTTEAIKEKKTNKDRKRI